MKSLKKGLKITFLIVLGLIITFSVYNFISIKLCKNRYTSVFGYTMLEVVSGSMEPTIHVNDFVIVNTKAKDFSENDIITFYDEENNFVTHRIIAKEENGFITKGDNNNTEDEMITKDQILGKYVLKLSGAGKILGAFKNPLTMVLIFVIGVLICIFISTDQFGNPIQDSDELEFQEFIKNKEEQNKKTDKKEENVKKNKKTEEKKGEKKDNKTTKKVSSKEEKGVKKNSVKKVSTNKKKEVSKKSTKPKTQAKKK